MFDRENAVGLLLLAVCAAIGGFMIFAIATGAELRYSGPGWLVWVLAILFLGGAVFGLLAGRGFGGFGGGRRWPDPLTGRRPWWKFWRRDDDGRS